MGDGPRLNEFDIDGERVLAFKSKAVGVTFDGRQAAVEACDEGQLLRVEHDRGNPKDRNAVLLRLPDGTELGHLSRDRAAQVGPLLRKKGAALGVVTGRTGDRHAGDRFGLNIAVAFGERGIEEEALREALRRLKCPILCETTPGFERPVGCVGLVALLLAAIYHLALLPFRLAAAAIPPATAAVGRAHRRGLGYEWYLPALIGLGLGVGLVGLFFLVRALA